jgi:hypothetical protein
MKSKSLESRRDAIMVHGVPWLELHHPGGVSERSKETVLKTVKGGFDRLGI